MSFLRPCIFVCSLLCDKKNNNNVSALNFLSEVGRQLTSLSGAGANFSLEVITLTAEEVAAIVPATKNG